MLRSLIVFGVLAAVPASAGEIVTRSERIWRTPDTRDVPADLRPRRNFDFQVMVDPRDRRAEQQPNGQGTAQRTRRPPTVDVVRTRWR